MQKRAFIAICFASVFFAVSAQAQGLHDTVTVTPQKPSFLDSLHFDLFNAGHCCCTQYYSKNVSVGDTTIMLSFQYDDSLCMLCLCLAAGSHTQFACGSQKAGKYGIYEAGGMYCRPGRLCPPGPIVFKRVGEVTVYTPTSAVLESHPSAVHSARASVKAQNGIIYSFDGRALTGKKHFGIAVCREVQTGATKILLRDGK
jgi:hypothetical protein